MAMETAVILLISMIAGGLSASNSVVYNVHTIQQIFPCENSTRNVIHQFENVKLQNMVASLEDKYKLVFKELMSIKAELEAHINSTVVQSGNRNVSGTNQHQSGFNLFLVAECPSGFTAWNNNCYKVVLNEGVSWAIAYGRCLNMGARLLVVETKAKWHSLVPILSQAYAGQTQRNIGLLEKDSTFWVLEDGTQIPLFEDIPWCPNEDFKALRRRGFRYYMYVDFFRGLCWSVTHSAATKGYICEKKLH